MEDPDLPIVRALQAGDDSALNELMNRHKRAVFGFVHRLVAGAEDAEELAQETFVRAYFKIDQFRPKAFFKTWLFQIARNLCRDHLRNQIFRSRQTSFLFKERGENAPVSASPSPDEALVINDQMLALERLIDHLPAHLKEPLVLTALEGHSYESAAEIIGVTPKSLEMKLYRVRRYLAKEMRKKGFFGEGTKARDR